MAQETDRIETSLENTLNNLHSIETEVQSVSTISKSSVNPNTFKAPENHGDEIVSRWHRTRERGWRPLINECQHKLTDFREAH